MRWTPKPLPKQGDKKTVKRFAILPMEMYNDITIWLEPYYSDKVYTTNSFFGGGFWRTVRRHTK